MVNVAVLITCYNRKEKTLECLKRIYSQEKPIDVIVDIYLVDGGSNDGTPDAVNTYFPLVNVFIVDGLFWAGGMRKAWEEALKKKAYDFLWLLNDDTFIYQNCLRRLLQADIYSIKNYNKHGIYSGATRDPFTGKMTYGGSKLKSNGDYILSDVIPDDNEYLDCDMCNANILVIPKSVYEEMGGLDEAFTHGIADWEYALRAKKAGVPVLLLPGYLGECERDHGKKWLPQNVSIKKRLSYMKSPKGMAYYEVLYFIRHYFPQDYISIKIKMWLQTLLPIVYDIASALKVKK